MHARNLCHSRESGNPVTLNLVILNEVKNLVLIGSFALLRMTNSWADTKVRPLPEEDALKISSTFLLAAFFALFTLSHAIAGTPGLINYQGTLTDKVGAPEPDGSYDAVFSIYTAPDNTNNTQPLWSESRTISVANGSFSIMLGANTPFPASVFGTHDTLYIGIRVGTDTEMTPRQRITSVAYSFVSDYAATAGSAATATTATSATNATNAAHATSADTATTAGTATNATSATSATTAGNGVPSGGIIMWSGAVNNVPSGWALCNGSNGTPDLRDRFVVGAGNAYAAAATGGAATVDVSHSHTGPSHTHTISADTTLTTKSDGTHKHLLPFGWTPNAIQVWTSGTDDTVWSSGWNGSNIATVGTGGIVGSGGMNAAYSNTDGAHSHALNSHSHTGATGASGTGVTSTAGSATLENRPPYYALAFIMKL